MPLVFAIVILSITGFLRDYYRVAYGKLIPFELLILFLPFQVVFMYTSSNAYAFLWLPFIIFCLRLASLVYEMPAILIEIGFIDDKMTNELLRKVEIRQHIADLIADGLNELIRKKI